MSPLRRPSSRVRNSAVSYDLPATTGKTVSLPLRMGLRSEYPDAGVTSPACSKQGMATTATTNRTIPATVMTSRIIGPPRSKDTEAPARARARRLRRSPRHAKVRACRGDQSRGFQECLSLLAEQRTHDLFFLASKKLLASSGICQGPTNLAKELTPLRRFTSVAGLRRMA